MAVGDRVAVDRHGDRNEAERREAEQQRVPERVMMETAAPTWYE